MKYLTFKQVLRIHERVIEETGGGRARGEASGQGRIGCRVPRQSYGGAALYPALYQKAAILGYALCQGHPFHDGNKRASHASMEMFLIRNGFEIRASLQEQEAMFLALADGKVSRDSFATWARSKIRRKPRRR